MLSDLQILKILCYRPAVKPLHLRNNKEISLMRAARGAIVLKRRLTKYSPTILSNHALLRTIILQLNSSRTKIQRQLLTIRPPRVPPLFPSANQMKRQNKLKSVKTNKRLELEIWLHLDLNLLKLSWRPFRMLPITRTL